MRFIWKAKTVGPSWTWLPIFFNEFETHLCHLVLQPDVPVSGGDIAVVIGQISVIKFPKNQFGNLDKPKNISVICKRLSDVIDLSAPVLAFWVRQEEDALGCYDFSGSNVNEAAFRGLPDAVKFSLDQYSFPLPDCPANCLSATISSYMLWHDTKTFIDWFIRQGVKRDINGRLFRDASAERIDTVIT